MFDILHTALGTVLYILIFIYIDVLYTIASSSPGHGQYQKQINHIEAVLRGVAPLWSMLLGSGKVQVKK